MDRASFLSCLPYLTPSSLSGWPPRRSGNQHASGTGGDSNNNNNNNNSHSNSHNNSSNNNSRCELLLSGERHQVSLEMIDSDDLEDETQRMNESTNASTSTTFFLPKSRGPIYFLPPTNDNEETTPDNHHKVDSPHRPNKPSALDPTLSSVEFCLELTPLAAAPEFLQGITSRATTSSAMEQCTNLWVRIQGRTYSVDWKALQYMRLMAGERTQTQAPQKSAVKKPPCLVLVFPSLLFRIFCVAKVSMSAVLPDEELEQEEQDLYELQTVQTRLAQALVQLQSMSTLFPTVVDLTTSPSSTTTHSGSGSQPQQQQQQQGQGDSQQKVPLHETKDGRDDDEDEEEAIAGSSRWKKKRRLSLEKCQSNLRSIQTILEAPVSALSSSEATATNDPTILQHEVQTVLSPLLTSAARHLSHSYVSTHHHYPQQQNGHDFVSSVAPLLDQFFPARRRRNISTTIMKPPPPISSETAMARAQQLLHEHQQESAERHRLVALPTKTHGLS